MTLKAKEVIAESRKYSKPQQVAESKSIVEGPPGFDRKPGPSDVLYPGADDMEIVDELLAKLGVKIKTAKLIGADNDDGDTPVLPKDHKCWADLKAGKRVTVKAGRSEEAMTLSKSGKYVSHETNIGTHITYVWEITK